MPRQVQASDAQTRLSQLLDAVEQGESIVITRRGRAIARLVPETAPPLPEHRQAVENIKTLGREIAARNGPITIEEIVSSIHEGHKY